MWRRVLAVAITANEDRFQHYCNNNKQATQTGVFATYFCGFFAIADTHSIERCRVAKLIAPRTATTGAMSAAENKLLATGIIKSVEIQLT
jgi:hypothetical protein